MEFSKLREIFKNYEDENGFIDKYIEEIAEECEDDSSAKIDLIKELHTVANFYNTEWEDVSEKRWRFTE